MPPQQEQNRAEDFLNAFNEIDRTLKARLRIGKHESFSKAVDMYRRKNPWWQNDAFVLKTFAELRNLIVHERFARYEYLSIPSTEAVSEIQEIRDRLNQPVEALAYLRKHHKSNLSVQSVEPSTKLPDLLDLMEEKRFTQFPVYGERGFEGLVTSNGLAYWLVERSNGLNLLDLNDHVAADLLPQEEARPNCELVPKDIGLEELLHRFVGNPQLEAVLITNSGKPSDKPLAIVTTSDVAQLRRATPQP